ncbi:MAG TPA: hypothetical protein VLX61_13005, partial [Anaerolineales bacterium]|nr:hypothetical protein [Anaerolineales bacterium]
HAGGAYLDNCNWNAGTVQCNSTTHSAVTITDSEFNGNNTHAGAAGLDVISNGAIKLTDVSASNNAGSVSGAALNNCNLNGNKCTTSGQAVTLSGTNVFDGNNYDGLRVQSGGAITSGSLEANYNAQFGAYFDNHYSTSAMPFTLTGTSSFSDNLGGDGLDASSNGVISVNNITADYNGSGNGASLQNYNSIGALSAVKVTGTNWFDWNSDNGLDVASYGAVSLNNINADYDGLATHSYGLNVQNAGVTNSVQSVTLTGTNIFNYNGYRGAEIEASGAVTLNNINAICNGYTTTNCSSVGVASSAGLYIDNSSTGKPQAVTLAGTNNISLSYGDNVDVVTYGAIKINNLTADDSKTGDGANLNFGPMTGAVTLTGTNTFDLNYETGLNVVSNGTISASNLNAVDNTHGDGVDLLNMGGKGGVTLTGTNTFDLNNGYGLNVQSNGAITASNLNALYNGSSNSDYGVSLMNSIGASTAAVTLSGTNTFDNNYSDGLYIGSYGIVTASNLTGKSNGTGYAGSYGVAIDNVPSTSATPNVALTGINTFDSNKGIGLYVESKGAISASNLNALLNGSASGDYGVDLVNNNGTSTAGVTLTGTNTFDTNYSDGLDIGSNGTVTASNLTASFNGTGARGVYISNVPSTGLEAPAVTLTGSNTFDNNRAYGLDVESKGTITTNNITANYNTNFGADLSNSFGSSGSINVKGTNVFLGNGGDGLDLQSNKTESVTHITADWNAADGLFALTTGSVKVTCGSFIGNGTGGSGYGWETNGSPSVTMIGIDAAGNSNPSQYSTNGSATPVFTPRTCTLP